MGYHYLPRVTSSWNWISIAQCLNYINMPLMYNSLLNHFSTTGSAMQFQCVAGLQVLLRTDEFQYFNSTSRSTLVVQAFLLPVSVGDKYFVCCH
ncbi:hypothetical protein FKM82_006763 [Ascaphus truei]